ncbi:Holliday junction DNA helicase RuvA [Candidatus Jorgensenbacteria bacterium RIFCSPLOWO2_02_FULL_45_12]|uniref:Holliday junction branch migration complex subunit RuvA n=2 Tax=Candidatus Joergenseniibacteriota TaxID=1752739 RepID=A0A1F6BQH5_9BACT|nr:MAG: Holliday junction ATP-dependent DNA helicase RuvA [Candidatus Jorgensenbacteria bacterium GW2011_GWA2_45_9]OGG39180.1 MAG: Holliday junction DNA helicase RuvA [Candidatus Jorgensenbacteria bacterium RIFCSPHIGHO2_02_FULL_45_20]OGG42758.1 MAG: Holliday junction DNA helicase RuvA [Candidatus Jorgensenbacteria bacterium RIFCSPLOWO2_02_FULL_45_12]
MFYFLSGKLAGKKRGFVVLENNGIGFKVFVNNITMQRIPEEGSDVKLFCVMRVRDDEPEIYGFADEPSLHLFDLLRTVPGIGAKSALSVLDIDSVENITAGILEKRADLLSRAPGVGKKTAERIVLELHNKIEISGAHTLVNAIDSNVDAEDALVGLGYDRRDARQAVGAVPASEDSFEKRLRAALRILGKTR